MSVSSPNLDIPFPPLAKPHSSLQDHKHRRTLSSTSPSRNSSLQKVWAEDYFDADDHTCEFERRSESITLPSAAALTQRPCPRSIPSYEDEEACPARQVRTNQHSMTALLQFRSRAVTTTAQLSPTKERNREEVEFTQPLTGDKYSTVRLSDKSKGGISSWFTGSSAPVAMGIPVGEQESSSSCTVPSREISPERPAAKLQRRPILPSPDSPNVLNNTTPNTSRFNFFALKAPVQKTIQLPQSSLDDDEFLTMDVKSALFPGNSPNPQDAFSPAAFKNLLMNAEGLLLKLQTAYKLRTLSLNELSSTHSALIDELEQAKTRAQCLRFQLEDMASKASEQDHIIADLVAQLATEKQARAEEKESRERSIQVITESRLATEALKSRESCCQEDPGIAEAKRRPKEVKEMLDWRCSGGSVLSNESDADSGPDSIFSRSRSPTLTSSSAASTRTVESTPEILQASFGRVITNPTLSPISNSSNQLIRPKIAERPSTFQKIFKRTSSASDPERLRDPDIDMFGAGIGMGGAGCENCRGKDASVAWNAVELLRSENRGLKDKIGALEDAVNGALDLCVGLRL